MRASTGPASAPWTTLTGMRVPGSTPSGTTRKPEALVPGWASTSPTFSGARGAAPAAPARRERTAAAATVTRLVMDPPCASGADQGGSPAHACPEGDQQDEVARLEAAAARALVPQQRDGGGGGVAVALDVVDHLAVRQAQHLLAVLVDALVGLVHQDQGQVRHPHAVGL